MILSLFGSIRYFSLEMTEPWAQINISKKANVMACENKKKLRLRTTQVLIQGSGDVTRIQVPCNSHLYTHQHGSILKFSIRLYCFQHPRSYVSQGSVWFKTVLSPRKPRKSLFSFILLALIGSHIHPWPNHMGQENNTLPTQCPRCK